MTLFDDEGSMSGREVLRAAAPRLSAGVILIASGFLPLLFGIALGFFEVEPCGSGFVPRAVWFDLYGDCSAAVGSSRALAIILIVIGVTLIGSGVILNFRRSGVRPPTTGQPAPMSSIASQIAELNRLHQDGVLDDSEFTAAKRKLLDER